MMTTFATVAGHFPLVLVSGPGAEARNSIGLVLVGGMAIGTLFTLFVIPSIYMLIARDLGGKLEELPEVDDTDLHAGLSRTYSRESEPLNDTGVPSDTERKRAVSGAVRRPAAMQVD